MAEECTKGKQYRDAYCSSIMVKKCVSQRAAWRYMPFLDRGRGAHESETYMEIMESTFRTSFVDEECMFEKNTV